MNRNCSSNPHHGKIHFNLWEANRHAAERAGVGQIEVSGICTACHTEDWFSHRAEKGRTGRFGALISRYDVMPGPERAGRCHNNLMNDLMRSPIRENYQRFSIRLQMHARRSAAMPEEVRLVVVTKTQPLEVVQAAIEAGVRILGENYPEEGVTKIQSLAGQSGVEWHMIGHVQSRKARLVADHFALLHSLDSLKLAQRLDRFAAERNRILPVLLEFNVGGEESKSGWNASDESQWDALLPEIAVHYWICRTCAFMD